MKTPFRAFWRDLDSSGSAGICLLSALLSPGGEPRVPKKEAKRNYPYPGGSPASTLYPTSQCVPVGSQNVFL